MALPRNLVTVMSLEPPDEWRNFVTVVSFAYSKNLVTEMSFSRNFVTVVSRYLLAAAARKSGVVPEHQHHWLSPKHRDTVLK